MKAKKSNIILLKKLLVSVVLAQAFLVGKQIPLPSVDHEAIKLFFESKTNYSTLNYISGNSLSQLGLFALNIFPELNASIILQFLIPFFPYLERLQKEEGEFGKKELTKIRKLILVLIAILQTLAILLNFRSFITNPILVGLLLVTGALLVSWISDLITEKGIATGSSFLLFINFFFNQALYLNLQTNFLPLPLFEKLKNLVVLGLIIYLALQLLTAKTKIPIVTSQQVASPDVDFLQKSTYIPLKLNQGGILPVALATSATYLPLSLLGDTSFIKPIIPFISLLFIVILNYFYTIFLWDPKKIAEDLRKSSSVVTGLPPGLETENFLEKKVTRYSIFGGIALASIAAVPGICKIFLNPRFFIFDVINISSLIIILGVLIEIFQNIQSQLIINTYLQKSYES